LTVGCAGPSARSGLSPAERPQPPRQAPARQPAADKRFIIAPELSKILHVVSVLLNNAPGAYLKIQVTLENMTEAPQTFRYRLEWFDQDGVRLPLAGQEFIPWMLLPHEVSSIAATAPSPAAADFGIAFVAEAR